VSLTPERAYECTGSTRVGVVTVAHWAPRAPAVLWLRGETQAGRTVEIVGDPYVDHRATVAIDGRPARVTRIDRARDGGTTTIRTDRGEIVFPKRLGSANRCPTLDGAELYA
jgi:hypothetical protein